MRRYRRSYWRELAAIVGVIVLGLFRWWSGDWTLDSPRPSGGNGGRSGSGGVATSQAGLEPGLYRVERVVDGDTLLLEGHRRLRLQGVNSPESVKPDWPVEPFGPEASAFTKQFVRDAGNQLRIEVDGESVDRHGRYLAFAWSGDRMLNEELVRAGLARATLGYDFSPRKKEVLRRAQQEAKRARRGIWSAN
ncbi:thermonuclease family protein [Lacipirellula parvula]|uniref:Phage-encoded chromosome degrading nuclease YokF n=1 Tax=Lacipirellula parvula TaxID=2650471 RepID=A0A5K7X6F9_9BACT|nr:thermonuclease family protein [Lacipirellula parvula]BBO32118.1 phage-encoded chromosome degrading nuclease YokF [Lacipirellula parvula]